MTRLRTLRLAGSPEARGRLHGRTWGAEIRRYAAERVHLAANGSWAGRPATEADVLALATAMLPAHRAYDPEVTAEMEAMAEAAGIGPAEALIAGGFTDVVDAVRRHGSAPAEDDCTAFLVPDGRADGAGWFGQTWDMHDSATEHVVLLDLRPDEAPPALVFTTVGCVAQIGMNVHGLAIGITNLTAADGGIGVTWPFLVRRALRCRTVAEALPFLLDPPLAGGHTFLLLDRLGDGAVVEAMPTHRAVTRLADRPLVHTNHCLVPEAAAREAARAEGLVASSVQRLAVAEAWLDRPRLDRAALEALTRETTAICRRSEPPFHLETSGAALMRPRTGEFFAVWGLPTEQPYERFVVGADG